MFEEEGWSAYLLKYGYIMYYITKTSLCTCFFVENVEFFPVSALHHYAICLPHSMTVPVLNYKTEREGSFTFGEGL